MADNQTPAKKKPHGLTGKPSNGRNSPVIGDNGLMLEPGDNSRFVGFGIQLMKLPKVDLTDIDAVENRLEEFFQICYKNDMKPAVAGLAMALGINRQRLWEIKVGRAGRNVDLPSAVSDSIKKAYENMEILWENYMLNGKINPVSGIFLGKNNFGYVDKQEHVITPNTPLGQEMDQSHILEQAKALPEYDGPDDFGEG